VTNSCDVPFERCLLFHEPSLQIVVVTRSSLVKTARARLRESPWVEVIGAGDPLDLRLALTQLRDRGMAVVSAVVMTSLNDKGVGTLSMIGIVQAQQQQGIWFAFKFFPLGFVALGIFAIAMVAETNRAPFDLPEAESELTAGFHTEYSGFRWSLFMLGEYAAMIAVSSVAVTLWLGGWLRPFPNALSGSGWDFVFSLFPGFTFLILAGFAFLGVIRMPEIAGNLNWGGRDWDDLYCACSTSIYRVRMKVRGNPVAYMQMA